MKWGCKSSWRRPTDPSFPETFSALKVPKKRGLQHGKSQTNQASLREEHSRGGNSEQEKSEVSKLGILEEEKGPGWLSGIRISESEADEVQGCPGGAHRGLHTYFTYRDWLPETFFSDFFFFLMWTIFKVFIEVVTVRFLFHDLVFWPQVMWDLNSPTRNQTHTPCIGGKVLTTGPPAKSPGDFEKIFLIIIQENW